MFFIYYYYYYFVVLTWCSDHNTGVLLIGGHSGVGKTSLIKLVFDLVYKKKEVFHFLHFITIVKSVFILFR